MSESFIKGLADAALGPQKLVRLFTESCEQNTTAAEAYSQVIQYPLQNQKTQE